MKIEQIKDLINEASDYKLKAKTTKDALKELSDYFGAVRVGSDAVNLGPLKPLYYMSNGVGHIVTNVTDFEQAMRQVDRELSAFRMVEPVAMKRDTYNRHKKDVMRGIRLAIDAAAIRLVREEVDLGYETKAGDLPRTQYKVEEQIIDDLLHGDSAKAVKALQAILIEK
jgi:hypothetical protein